MSGPDGAFRQRYQAENQWLVRLGPAGDAIARKDFGPAAFDPAADLLGLSPGWSCSPWSASSTRPRPAVRASIATATQGRHPGRMITGDYAVTAAAVAGQLGIDGSVLTGAEFARAMQRAGYAALAKVASSDAARRVKKADIGTGMGTGTEETTEAAVMILTDDNFASSSHHRQGRRTRPRAV